jgi:hypothetical protein
MRRADASRRCVAPMRRADASRRCVAPMRRAETDLCSVALRLCDKIRAHACAARTEIGRTGRTY